jgi:hypothetical protein
MRSRYTEIASRYTHGVGRCRVTGIKKLNENRAQDVQLRENLRTQRGYKHVHPGARVHLCERHSHVVFTSA